jgi:phytoene dehydrogenase-like protein
MMPVSHAYGMAMGLFLAAYCGGTLVILPRYDGTGKTLSYSLEPSIAPNTIDPTSNLSWDYSKGELGLEITSPDGTKSVRMSAPIVAKTGMKDLAAHIR